MVLMISSLRRVDEVIAFFLGMLFGVDRIVKAGRHTFSGDPCRWLDRTGAAGQRPFFGLSWRVKILDGGDDFLDLRVAEFEGIGQRLLRRLQARRIPP